MNTPAKYGRSHGWGRLLAASVKWTGICLAGCAGAVFVLGVVLWDVDFRLVRDKYENMKLALFGEWNPAPKRSLEDIFERIDSVSLFQNASVRDVGVIVTGARFTSSQAVEENIATNKWCYIKTDGDIDSDHVTLGNQTGTEPPHYTDTNMISADVLTEIGVSAERLATLAKLHCRLKDFRAR